MKIEITKPQMASLVVSATGEWNDIILVQSWQIRSYGNVIFGDQFQNYITDVNEMTESEFQIEMCGVILTEYSSENSNFESFDSHVKWHILQFWSYERWKRINPQKKSSQS